jgi:uncharacterized protein YuzE
MDFSFDKVANALYLRFSRESIKSSEEIVEGTIIDYGLYDNLIGIEVLNFTKKKLNLNKLIQMSEEEIIPIIVQCQ